MSRKQKQARAAALAVIQTPAAPQGWESVPAGTDQVQAEPDLSAPADQTSPVQTPARKQKRPQGLGYPQAKKLVNPQQTLELKKSAARAAGFQLSWTNRSWRR